MDDLITKFFQEDLTEAEEKVLGERLMSSMEDALRFGQHAETAYHYCGLPEPHWPGGPSASGGIKLKHWMWLGVALTGITLLALWRHFAQPVQVLPEASIGSSTLKMVDLNHLKTKSQSEIQVQKENSGISKDEKSQLPEEAEKVRTQSDVRADLSQMKPVLTPIDLTAQPHRSHTNLSVVLRRTSPGKVTLRVLNGEGTQVVLLYDGLLQPGNWSFDWDGKLADGEKPTPGKYKIQVESGLVTQVKSIHIR
jgi:hypothetical protein